MKRSHDVVLSSIVQATFGIALIASAIPAHAETCGIDRIFADGFQVQTFVPVESISGGIPSPGLTQSIVGAGTFSVAITIPASGSTTGESNVDVAGTFVGPLNSGISINHIAGFVSGTSFLVPQVPLVDGGNTLSLQAATLPGATASASLSVTRSGSPSPARMSADRQVGFAPFPVDFSFGVGTFPGNATVQSVVVNFKGTGPDDYSGSSLAGAPTRYTYSQPGLYFARLTITDSNNVVYTTMRAILAQDFAAQRGMMCDIYGYVKNRLVAQDATGAGNAFHVSERSGKVALFNDLGTNMPDAAQRLGVVVNGQVGSGFADLLIVRDNPDQTRSGFPMRLTQGTDGVWRISEM